MASGAGRQAVAGLPACGAVGPRRKRVLRSFRPALAVCSGALALGAAAAVWNTAVFLASDRGLCATGRGHLRGGPAAAARSAVRRQSTATFSGSASSSPSSFPGFVPDTKLHGKLRSLGRLLLIAGQKLLEASSRRAAWLDTSVVVSDEVLRVSGTALQGAAKALLKDRWDHARHFLTVARSEVDPLFPQEQLEVLKGMLSGSSALVDATAALAGFGRTLEMQAERVGMACSGPDRAVCGQLEDAFFDAASALSAAARLFDKKANVASPDADAAAAAVEPPVPHAASAFAQIDEALATASSPQHRRSALRELAKRFHPDRHPGREFEVLAAFRQVQKLRSEERWMEHKWGA